MSCAPIPRPRIRQIDAVLPPFDVLLPLVNDQQAHHGTLLVSRAVNSSRPLQAVAGSSVAPVTPWFEHRRPKQHQGTCKMGNTPRWAAWGRGIFCPGSCLLFGVICPRHARVTCFRAASNMLFEHALRTSFQDGRSARTVYSLYPISQSLPKSFGYAPRDTLISCTLVRFENIVVGSNVVVVDKLSFPKMSPLRRRPSCQAQRALKALKDGTRETIVMGVESVDGGCCRFLYGKNERGEGGKVLLQVLRGRT